MLKPSFHSSFSTGRQAKKTRPQPRPRPPLPRLFPALALSLSLSRLRALPRSPSLSWTQKTRKNKTEFAPGKSPGKNCIKKTGWSRLASRSAWAATTRTATSRSARGPAWTAARPSSGRRRAWSGSCSGGREGPRAGLGGEREGMRREKGGGGVEARENETAPLPPLSFFF